MEEIASKAKRRLFGLGFFDTPQSREQMLAMAQKGWLRIYILYLQQKTRGVLEGSSVRRVPAGAHVGYDPVWSEFSPGIFLFLSMIEELRKEGVNIVDLGFGDTQFKKYLGNLRRVESQVRIYPKRTWGPIEPSKPGCPRINNCARFLIQRTGGLEWMMKTRRERLELQNGARNSSSEWPASSPRSPW